MGLGVDGLAVGLADEAVATLFDVVGCHGLVADAVLGFAQDHALVDESLKRLARAQVAQVVEHFVPESGVQQVQHRVLDAADVEVDGHPVRFLGRIDEPVCVVGVKVTQVVPAAAGPLGHRVRLTLIRLAVALDGQPIGRLGQRAFGAAGRLEVFEFGQRDGQFALVDGVVVAVGVEEDRERLAPVPLA